MDFRFDDTQIALRDAVGSLCDEHFALASISAREGVAVPDATWRALDGMGVFSVLVPSDQGGFGGGAVEAAIAFEQFGAHLANGPLLWSTIAVPSLPIDATGAHRVAGIDLVTARQVPHVIEHAHDSDIIVVLYDDHIEQCPTSALGTGNGTNALDPLTPAVAYDALPTGTTIGNHDDADAMRRLGTVLTAAELVGVAQGALDVAAAYALQREQFGVPIGSFQAVKHILADMYVRVELARSATYAAAALIESAADTSVAKLLAGEAAIANGRAAVQVLGGMGFTWEMLPHYFLKRALVLEQRFGTADTHALALAETLAH